MLFDYARDNAMLGSLAFAVAIRDAASRDLSDLEYGDCYLCAMFCLASEISGSNVQPDLIAGLFERFDRDVEFLVFANDSSIADLTSDGAERFGQYREHPDAILPQAYLHLLAQVVRRRRQGHETPYADLDPMVMADPILLASLEQAWEGRASKVVAQWKRVVEQVQIEAEDQDQEFWPDVD
ncbi:hypothetical protein EJ078_10855 [Mesorhizobium sp. M1A.F.Ca.IN.022.06.1.1]|uniref:hypothetical protein n=1 Tax=Mesorhizobium sp. M1A.F.Ca.IN.022.06.1.1 TaxID=2493680 RepID=UPI000F752102|nr:hypothetical protein [Mesorhizobium sp. M1A.F.Ca.IN.022.06.1.1]AZO59678.1 hypothetical protein EJ078_10855 [Mesorhizobium sp. M1A.F.Ca.IN.022.06.1.1]